MTLHVLVASTENLNLSRRMRARGHFESKRGNVFRRGTSVEGRRSFPKPERSAGEERRRGAPERSAGEERRRGAPERSAGEERRRGAPERSAGEERRRGAPDPPTDDNKSISI
ncbi:hypothetical protein DPEC_G00292640 [Dallia pectoralis]|uniref:Uncharacterized protein n=1 Tax=Dallia pectoralis TaxID=75939 RepID=A0ACC2FIC3_DALPE|nr:hypothetical protein DPEC_G00292640 [Dallia pectoralis]